MESSSDVSRSGRVRKKSTKLADFHTEENANSETNNFQDAELDSEADEDADDGEAPSADEMVDIGTNAHFHAAGRDPFAIHDSADLLSDSMDEEGDLPLTIDDSRGLRRGSSSSKNRNRHGSSSKKSPSADAIKMSAYSMYCRAARPAISARSPGIKFVEMNSRLSQAWARVSEAEKDDWRRKADEANALAGFQEAKRRRKSSSSFAKKVSISEPPVTSTAAVSSDGKLLDPVDAAAHLKLLGESLSVIGKRLQEHKGSIAVSGSLSVLLDSMVCAMAPLVCLSSLVPETAEAVPTETASALLDSVAYIMPGL